MSSFWGQSEPSADIDHLIVRVPPQNPQPRADYVVDFGTSSTVVAAFKPPSEFLGQRRYRVKFLVGENEPCSSEVLVSSSDGQVLAVGPDAAIAFASNRTDCILYQTLKRYLESLSRSSAEPAMRQSAVIRRYLQKSLEKPYSRLGREWRLSSESLIFVSVPNSFNGTAISAVRQAVVDALNALEENRPQADDGRTQSSEILRSSVHIVREGEAVANVYAHFKDADRRSEIPLNWVELRPLTVTRAADVRARGRLTTGGVIVVLDIGAGTTDLTVFRLGAAGESVDVLMNCGVPIGGSDVDRILLSGLVLDEQAWRTVPAGPRSDIERAARVRKEQEGIGLSGFFVSHDYETWRTTDAAFKQSLAGIDLAPALADERAKKRLARLVSISIDGLLNLIPRRLIDAGIEAVLLTGRASLLPEIRDAVQRHAHAFGGAPTLTLDQPYHLKLAVAYGCIRASASIGRRQTAATTLGRQLAVVVGNSSSRSLNLDPDLPISTEAPTLWRALPQRDSNETLHWYERRVNLKTASDPENDAEDLERLGLAREVASLRPESGRDRAQPLFVLWSSDLEEYFVRGTTSNTSWARYAGDRGGIDLRATSPLTGLPIGFPHENEN